MLLKRFGSVLVNWIGYLPIFDLVFYPKYLEPLIALCIAMLGGIGFALLVEQRITRRQLALATTTTLGLMLLLAGVHLPGLTSPALKYANVFFYLSLASGALVISAVALMSWLAGGDSVSRAWPLRAIVVLLGLELTFNFIVPSFYVLTRLPPIAATPYAGAPYIRAIQQNNMDYARLFGRENELYPNWSAAFKLADVRSLDAIHYVRYRAFIRNFLLTGPDDRIHGDLADRFTGQEFTYAFDTDAEKRFLALSSVRYLITDSDFGISSKLVEEILRQHKDEFIWGLGVDTFQVDGRDKTKMRGLRQYPPSAKVSFKTRVDPHEPILEGVAALKSGVSERSDGVGFRLELRDGDKVETLFHAFLDPNGDAADRAGRPFRLDLRAYGGRQIELLFSTDPGPKSDNTGDWAGWAGLRFVSPTAVPPASPFRKIYDDEVRIYEVPSVLPRASLYGAIEISPDGEVLARLKDPAFNPFEKAIVSRESLPPDQSAFAGLAQSVRTPVSAARIARYESQYVRIEAEAPVPSLLVLNDSNYPGWQAYLDGRPAPTVMTNYLFRGVMVQAGKSVVEFRYEPLSVRAGGGVAFVAFLALAGLVYRERRRRRTRLRRSP
jgi:hypothetical protein